MSTIDNYRHIVSGSIVNPYHQVHYDQGGKVVSSDELAKLKDENPNLIHKGTVVDNWKDRLPMIVENFKRGDLIAVQSFNCHTYNEVRQIMAGENYSFSELSLCQAGPTDTSEKIVGMAIGVNNQKFRILKPHLFKAGSWPRGQIFCDVLDLATNKIIRIASMHLKGYDHTIYDPVTQKEHFDRVEAAKKAALEELQCIVLETTKDTTGITSIFIAGICNFVAGEVSIHSPDDYMKSLGWTWINQGPTEHGLNIDTSRIYALPLTREIIQEKYTFPQNREASNHDFIGIAFR